MAEIREESEPTPHALRVVEFVADMVKWAKDEEKVKLAHIRASPRSMHGLETHQTLVTMVNEFLDKSNYDMGWSLTHYVHKDDFRTYEAMQRRTNAHFNLNHFLLLNLTQTGSLQENRIVLIECDEESDIHYAVGMLRLARTIGNVLASNRSARLRIIFMSPESDPDVAKLTRKLAMFAPSNIERLQFTWFDYPDFHTCSFIEDLTWKTYPVDDATFLRQVAENIAPDFAVYNDLEDGNTTGPLAKALVHWYSVQLPYNHHRPELLAKALGNIVSEDESAFMHWNKDSGAFESKTIILKMERNPRLATLPAGTKHIILCDTKRQAQFDTETLHAVIFDGRVSRANLKSQAGVAFVNAWNTPVEEVTIHSQHSLDNIKAMPARILFEELHLASFLVMAWDIDPTLQLDQLLDHFIERTERVDEAMRRLLLLNLLKSDESKVLLNKALVKKVASILPVVDFDLQTATFLSQMTSETPHAQRQAMIDMAAIACRWHPTRDQTLFIDINEEILDIGTLDGEEGKAKLNKIKEECRDVPLETISDGSIWLALGVYRMLRRFGGASEQNGPTLQLGLFKVSVIEYNRIRNYASKIGAIMMQATPPFNNSYHGSTKLESTDVLVLQEFMLRAWCVELIFIPYSGCYLDLVSKKSEGVFINRRLGFFRETAGQPNSFLVAFVYFKIAGQTGDIPLYEIGPVAKIPNAMVDRFLKDRGLGCEDLATPISRHRT